MEIENKKVTVFLPCRAGSQRVVRKNVKDFAGIAGGLTKIKIEQLIKIKNVENIVVSTDDEEVKEIARSVNDPKIIILDRPAHLASSATKTDELIQHVPTIIESGVILWTHVTSPFIDSEDYDNYITKYFEAIEEGKDSLMTVNRIHKFIWNDNEPINYDRAVEKWPRTQTLAPIYEVNSGAFIADINVYKEFGDRIGAKPYMYELDDLKSFDIDWNLNFITAELFWANKSLYNVG